MTGMGQLSVRAIVLGLLAGFLVSAVGLVVVVATVAFFGGIDITDVGKNGEVVRRASIQVPILATWLLGLLAAGMTAGRFTRGRAWHWHGAVIGGVALLAALSGISARDPSWAIALELLLTVPVAILGAGLRPVPRDAAVKFLARWELAIGMVGFSASTLMLTVYDDVPGWAAFALTGAMLANAVRRRFRGSVVTAGAAEMAPK